MIRFNCLISLQKPDRRQLEALKASQRNMPVTYERIGATERKEATPGYEWDEHRTLLGRGEDVFEAARDVLSQWGMLPDNWIALHSSDTPQRRGRIVVIAVKVLFTWWLNSAKIVYTINEYRRYGFAYGTLPAHAECGEERFLVEMDDEGRVWYRITAFSRPRHWLAKIFKNLTRRYQMRFAQDSIATVKRAVGEKLALVL